MSYHPRSPQEPTPEEPEALLVQRRRLMARLAAEHAELLWQLPGLDEGMLTEAHIFDRSDWTVKDLLAHVAAWDRWEHEAMAALAKGDEPAFDAVDDVDAFNTAAVEAWRERALGEVLNEMESARAAWTAWLHDVPLEAFFRSRQLTEWDSAFPNRLEIQWEHDAEHAAELAAWRQETAFDSGTGPKAVLRAALSAARDELLTAAALIAPAQRTSRPVCGHWTLKDLVGHVADWEQVGVEGLRDMAAGHPPDVAYIPDIDAWNARHAAARQDQTWETCWTDLHETREQLLAALGEMDQTRIDRAHVFPWGPEGTAYEWVRVFGIHDREHARDLRDVVDAQITTREQG